ncbi:MAG: hypothetical protein KA248_12770 [Kiritimatiellae bacterium]|nr:hypothetical protein [Kiritimatiellia bacterium]
MKMRIPAMAAALLIIGASALQAAILTETPEPLLETGGLGPVSVGAFYQLSRRQVETDRGFQMDLEARTYEALLGIDVLPWLTLYGSAGGSDARLKDISYYGEDRFSWAVGFNMNLWQWVGYGEMPVWRVTFKTRAEMAMYETEGAPDIEWTDYTVSFPVGYEVVFSQYPDSFSDLDHLELFVGPVLSYIDGEYDQGGGGIDFEEKHSLGVTGGASLFVTETLFLGLQATYFDRFLIRGGIGYSFQ